MLCNPTVGVLYRLWFGVEARAGHSTDAERMAKIALLFALGDWPEDVLLAADSAALMSNLTRAPPASSALIVPFCTSLVELRARLFEVLHPA